MLGINFTNFITIALFTMITLALSNTLFAKSSLPVSIDKDQDGIPDSQETSSYTKFRK